MQVGVFVFVTKKVAKDRPVKEILSILSCRIHTFPAYDAN